MADVNICECAINEYICEPGAKIRHSARTVCELLSQTRYYIPKSVYHCRFRTHYLRTVNMKMVFIRAGETSVCRIHRKSGARNYTIFNLCHVLNRHSAPCPLPATAYFNRATFLPATGAFYHLTPRAKVIA